MHRSDTSEQAQRVYDDLIRRLSEEERFLRGISLTHFARETCLAGLKDRFPALADRELKVKFFEQVYGHLFSEEERQRILPKLG